MKSIPIVKSKEEATEPSILETNDIQPDAVSCTPSTLPIVNRMKEANHE